MAASSFERKVFETETMISRESLCPEKAGGNINFINSLSLSCFLLFIIRIGTGLYYNAASIQGFVT